MPKLEGKKTNKNAKKILRKNNFFIFSACKIFFIKKESKKIKKYIKKFK